MNKIDKVLSKIPPKYREKILSVLIDIESGWFENLDMKKLKGHPNFYRVRIGIYRIQFQIDNKNIYILKIDKRNDNTYL